MNNEIITRLQNDNLRLEAQNKRYRVALQLILEASGGECQSFTTGIGSCYTNGKVERAEYGADQVCDACITQAALKDKE